jgi:hypothetical protein
MCARKGRALTTPAGLTRNPAFGSHPSGQGQPFREQRMRMNVVTAALVVSAAPARTAGPEWQPVLDQIALPSSRREKGRW